MPELAFNFAACMTNANTVDCTAPSCREFGFPLK